MVAGGYLTKHGQHVADMMMKAEDYMDAGDTSMSSQPCVLHGEALIDPSAEDFTTKGVAAWSKQDTSTVKMIFDLLASKQAEVDNKLETLVGALDKNQFGQAHSESWHLRKCQARWRPSACSARRTPLAAPRG